MPGNARFEYGYLEAALAQAGFGDVTTEDITAQMLPMARCFAATARLPYELARLARCTDKIINSTASVEFWKYRQYYRYQVYTARR
jgi:sterol 24-C-methyltransferase